MEDYEQERRQVKQGRRKEQVPQDPAALLALMSANHAVLFPLDKFLSPTGAHLLV